MKVLKNLRKGNQLILLSANHSYLPSGINKRFESEKFF